MEYRGKVSNGIIVLDGDVALREGAAVKIVVEEPSGEFPTLAERFKNVTGKAVGLPPNLAENHDHYVHGQPKKSQA